MKTASRAQTISEPRVDDHGDVMTGAWEPDHQKGVIAVVVEREDGSCSLFCRGFGGSWLSIDEAKSAVEKASGQVAWRETTSGVWVARVNVNGVPASDRGLGRRRRAASDRSMRPSVGGDSYMAARVLRGTARIGHSPDGANGSSSGLGFEGERQAG